MCRQQVTKMRLYLHELKPCLRFMRQAIVALLLLAALQPMMTDGSFNRIN